MERGTFSSTLRASILRTDVAVVFLFRYPYADFLLPKGQCANRSMLDYDVKRCTRKCAITDRPFAPGEEFFSVLQADGAEVVRKDFAKTEWNGPPKGVLGWWKSRMPVPTSKRASWAPNDVMLDLFEQWENDLERLDIRYVLALLLIRRRVFRQEQIAVLNEPDSGPEQLLVFCPRKDKQYELPVVIPNAARAEEIQEILATLLFAQAT